MTKPIQLLGRKQMKQVVANTSRLNFEISLRLLVCLCLTSRFNRKTTPPPCCKDAKSSKFECRIQRQKCYRQTDTKTNQRTPTPSFCVRQLFISSFISFSIFLSFFLSSFFLHFLFFFLTSLLSFFSLSFFLAFFLFVFLNYFSFFSLSPLHHLNHSFYLFNFFFSHCFSLFNISLSCNFSFCILSFVSFVHFFLHLIFALFFSLFHHPPLSLSLSLSQSINRPIYLSIHLSTSLFLFLIQFVFSFHLFVSF